jgi:hypothetical protein
LGFFVEAQFAIASAQHTELLQHHMISPRELPFSLENIMNSEIYSPDLTSCVYFRFNIKYACPLNSSVFPLLDLKVDSCVLSADH